MVNTLKIDIFVSVIVIVENDQSNSILAISKIIRLLDKNYTNYELIIIDNGSKAKFLHQLTNLIKTESCVRLIKLAKAYEIETAIFAGLDSAIGDFCVVVIPSSDPPSVISLVVDKLIHGYEIVIGESTITFPQPLWSKLGSQIFYWYVNKIINGALSPKNTYLLGLNRRALNALTRYQSMHRHVRLISSQLGYKTIPFRYRPKRQLGFRSRRNLFQSMDRALNIIVSHSQHPLRLVTWIGFTAGLLNLVYMIYIISVFIIKDRVAEGWTTTSMQLSIMFFFVFLILTILAEYIGHILAATKNYPSYQIVEEITSTTLITDRNRRNISK